MERTSRATYRAKEGRSLMALIAGNFTADFSPVKNAFNGWRLKTLTSASASPRGTHMSVAEKEKKCWRGEAALLGVASRAGACWAGPVRLARLALFFFFLNKTFSLFFKNKTKTTFV